MEKEMTNTKITIVITVYNIEKYISECLNSIINQTIKNIEIICVDDASTDKSLQILNEYQKKDSRIIILHNNKNQGQASSRNRGCCLARGEYLYVMDGDDRLQDGALDRLYNCAKENKLDFVTFSASVFTNENNLEMSLANKKMENLYLHNCSAQEVKSGIELLAEIMENDETPGNLCLQFVNREFFEKNNLYWIEELRYGEDSPFKMYMCAKRTMCIPDRLYQRRIRNNSMVTSVKKLCHLESMIIQFAHDLQEWEKHKNYVELNSRIEKYFKLQHRSIESMYAQVKDTRELPNLINKYPMARYIYYYFIVGNPLYCKNLTVDVIEKIKMFKYVIVYGAGFVAKDAVSILEKNGIYNYKIAVTDKRREKETAFQEKINNIDELEEISNEAIVIVATLKRHYDSIQQTLSNKNFDQVIYVD